MHASWFDHTQNLTTAFTTNKSVAPTPIPACPVKSRPLSPRPARVEYTAGLIEGKWPRTIKAQCCKLDTKLPAYGVAHFIFQPLVAVPYPTDYRAVTAPLRRWFVTQPENRQTPRRCYCPVMRLSCGNSSRAPANYRRTAKCDASDTPPRRKFKLLRPILAKILTIPMS